MRWGFGLLAVVAWCLAATSPALCEDVPVLMPDTGGHQAVIRSLIFTADGKYLLSAGEDKVVRVWDWRAGKTVRSIRGQLSIGSEGKIFSMALSPDGHWLAVGGFFAPSGIMGPDRGWDIRLYDFATGELKALLKGHTNTIYALAFSPDSKLLISAGADHTAIIWNIEKRQPLHSPLQGHTGAIYGAGFTPDGLRAVTSSFDKTLQLWNVADGRLIKVMQGHNDQVSTLAVSPKDGTIASGDSGGEIRLWDGRTGDVLRSAPFARLGGYVGKLSFSPDGRLLLATCGFTGCKNTQKVFDVTSGKELKAYSKHNNTVVASTFSADGQLVATGGGDDQEIHIWDPRSGDTKAVLKGTGRSEFAVAFSADGRQFAWGSTGRIVNHNNYGPLEMTLRLPSADAPLGEPEPVSSQDGWIRAQDHLGTWSLQHKAGGEYGYYSDAILDIIYDGKVQASVTRTPADGYAHRSYGFTPDGETIISGGNNGLLIAYRRDGTKIGRFVGHESDVWAVAVSPDGRYLVSGSWDQTVRLWDVKSRQLLVSVLYGSDREWVMWTPEGFYTSSKKGAARVGWQINHGADKAADYVNGEQLRDAFFRPDLVAAKIAGDPGGKVRDAAAEINIDDIIKSGIAPEVKIIKTAVRDETVSENGVERSVEKVEVTARVVDKGGGIGRIGWRVNDAVVQIDYGAGGLNRESEVTRSFELTNPGNSVVVTAENRGGKIESKSAAVAVDVDERKLKGLPNLYILAVGVNSYQDVKRKLSFAVSDAEALSAAIAEAGKDYYRSKPQVTLLRDDEVTAEKLQAVFNELHGKVKANDVFLFFIAGHGKTINGDYYFVPANITTFDERTILKQGIGKTQWRDWFAMIPAQKAIFIFDTCESGSMDTVIASANANVTSRDVAFDTAQQRLKEATGRSLFTASSDQQSAVEGYKQHGLLTYAILEGLAKAGGDKPFVWLTDLKDYVEDKVRDYSKAMKSCSVIRQQEYCQTPKVLLGENNYAIVPRYAKIMATLQGAGEAYSRVPTHVVIAATELHQTARGDGPATQLPPGTLVTQIKTDGEYVFIAKDGKPIGYVLRNMLVEVK
jgi:WD40 repeat protein